MSERFADRTDAGHRLAGHLSDYAGRSQAVVLGLPRGGIPVAHEVAQTLGLPLDAFLVRKLGVPGHEELAMGAIASGGAWVLNRDVLVAVGVSERQVEEVAQRELRILEEQERRYRGGRPPLEIAGRTGILVDDGLATGATMRAAVQALRTLAAGRIVVAVPVAPRVTCAALRSEVDEVICPLTPDRFTAVGLWYRDFAPVSDETVAKLLSVPPPEGHGACSG